MPLIDLPTYLAPMKKQFNAGICINCNRPAQQVPGIGWYCDTDNCERDLKTELRLQSAYEPNRLTGMFAEFTKVVHSKMMDGFFKKGRTGWDDPDWTEEEIKETIRHHIDKGDPRDVAALAAFWWNKQQNKSSD